uniref:CCR4-NOT transcription complex subunit 10 n=1 Tax=Oncorhynchus tshawytscha TaxID=74940 RepID=A0AAZ3ST62_ONCTS
ISDQEKAIAANALEAFTAGNYEESLKHLGKLQELNKEDYKIALNKAIAEFYKSGQTTTCTLKQTLIAMKNQVHTSMEDIDGLDDVENSLLYYNQAIIHYHMRQYSEAIAIGERLYQFLEPFEEKFALAVCFLLVDLYLLTYQPEKALHLLAVLEKLSVQGNNKNGNEDGKAAFELLLLFHTCRSSRPQYKVRAYIQMKSSKACKREIKSVMNTAGNSASSLFLKSNFEYLRGNYRKAVKLLNSSNIAEHPGAIKTGECVRCMFWNNLGCIHFAMGKHNLGIFYFKKALQENDHTCAQLGDAKQFSGIPMCALLANKRYELLYNCGIQLLHIGRPLAAFDCLMDAVQVYHSNPGLWLRLAECCIAANKGSLEQDNKGLPSKKGIVQAIVGQGYHRKIILASQSTQNTIYSDGQSAAIPVASMEFAAICLRNGLVLLPDHQQQENKAENGSKTTSQSGSTESGSENKALISLDRISEAIGHLNPENVTDVSMGVLSSEQDQGPDKGDLEPVESSGKQTPLCYPSTVSSARAIMLFNLGSAYCLRSEYEKARKCLHQAASMVNTKEIPPEAILLAVYLELQNGNTQLALQIIKRNQLLPSVLQAPSPDTRKKPVPSSFQPVQPPIQMPSPFTTVQRK